jgi:hypothetical protein
MPEYQPRDLVVGQPGRRRRTRSQARRARTLMHRKMPCHVPTDRPAAASNTRGRPATGLSIGGARCSWRERVNKEPPLAVTQPPPFEQLMAREHRLNNSASAEELRADMAWLTEFVRNEDQSGRGRS